MKTISFIFNLFFDDYGIPCVWAWVIYFILCGITVVFFWCISLSSNEEGKALSKYCSYSAIFLYVCLFYLVNSLNPYEYIPFIGTDIQKANLRRCTVGKTVNLENIKDIMTDCKKRDQELKFKEILIGK